MEINDDMGSETDQEFTYWAQRISASDEEAFTDLFRSTFPRMVKFAWRYTRSKASANDVVQEVFVKLWEIRSNIDPEQSLKSYLYQMVRNRALNHIRDRKNLQGSLEDIAQEKLQADEYVSTAFLQNESLDKKMGDWISNLPKRQREAIELSRFEGLEHDEIAEVMKVSPRTVNNHIVAALKTLRSQWNAYKMNQQG